MSKNLKLKYSVLLLIAIVVTIPFLLPLPHNHSESYIVSNIKEFNHYAYLYKEKFGHPPTDFKVLIQFIEDELQIPEGKFLKSKFEIRYFKVISQDSIKVNYNTDWPWNKNNFWCFYQLQQNANGFIVSYCKLPSGVFGITYRYQANGINDKEKRRFMEKI